MQLRDKLRLMPVAIALPVDEMKSHATLSGKGKIAVVDGLITTNHANRIKAEQLAGSRGGVYVIGPGAAKGEQSVLLLANRLFKIVFQLAPLVAAKLRMAQIFTFDIQRDSPFAKQRALQALQRRRFESMLLNLMKTCE